MGQDFKEGQMVNQFRIVKRIGKGGFSKVYKAIDTEKKEKPYVALKVANDKLANDEEGRLRFYHEAKLLSQIESPHVIDFFEHGKFGSHDYLVLDLIEGRNLFERIEFENGLHFLEATRIAFDIANLLPVLEKSGIVHRDIKPKNILIDSRGNAVLIDFGLAYSRDLGYKESKKDIYGTVDFLAPEYVTTGVLNPCVDVYALGVTYAVMLQVKTPFDGPTTTRVLLNHINRPPKLNFSAGVPENVKSLIHRMLEKDPDKRCSAEEVIEELSSILEGSRRNPVEKRVWKLIHIIPSNRANKKFKAQFMHRQTGRLKNVHFGGAGYSDYTKHKDPERKRRYIIRHQKRENWDDPTTPGALSRWVLWNLPDFKASVDDFVKRFDL